MAKLVWRLEQVLGFDLLELADHGAAFEPLTEPRPDGLFVHAQWVFDSDGKVFRGADDPTAFADVEVRVLITVEVPGLEEALTIRLRSETGEELTVREKRLPHVDAGRRADSVYGSIIRHSVASLETELERALDPEASARPIAWGRERLKP